MHERSTASGIVFESPALASYHQSSDSLNSFRWPCPLAPDALVASRAIADSFGPGGGSRVTTSRSTLPRDAGQLQSALTQGQGCLIIGRRGRLITVCITSKPAANHRLFRRDMMYVDTRRRSLTVGRGDEDGAIPQDAAPQGHAKASLWYMVRWPPHKTPCYYSRPAGDLDLA